MPSFPITVAATKTRGKIPTLALTADQISSYFISYAPPAAMSLFVNVLVHPLHRSSDEDLRALGAALSNIRSMPLRGLTKEETDRLQGLHNFFMELVRLGNCAVWKAKKDRGI